MLQLAVRPYRRPFRTPLQTHHGLWGQREGLIMRLQDDKGQVGFGEIAPIPWFGTETLAMAKDLCAQWSDTVVPEQIAAIPAELPACQFGFAQALRSLHGRRLPDPKYSPAQICALLPAGAAALEVWSTLWQRGHRTFKWKIGVAPFHQERALFQALVAALPPGTHLRLDANGGLTPEVGQQWLMVCDAAPDRVEFLEQPLPPDVIVDWVSAIAGTFQTAIALDESVATISQLQSVYQRLQNRVVYVVKPAIAGFSEQLYTLCTQHHLEIVVSSALETPVGRRAALMLAQRLWAAGVPQRPLGFGVGHWFQDNWDTLSEEALWSQL
ncbi:MAG: o-succinylbenzoate synthase [Leptolyngbya sp. SIO1E4]|nr:o-succinylbenzoate synthase [Leptolyngbya sp. SIO1E4]